MVQTTVTTDTYFVVDKNVVYFAKHLRQMGLKAESVIEIKRRIKKIKIHRDEHILEYVIENNAFLITADEIFYNRCKNTDTPAFFVKIQNGLVYNKIEQIMIFLAHFYPMFFHNWLIMGKPHWSLYLKYGDGNWDQIKKESKFKQTRINQLMNFDSLCYPKLIHNDRQMRIWGGSKRLSRSISRKRRQKKINEIIHVNRLRKKARIKNQM